MKSPRFPKISRTEVKYSATSNFGPNSRWPLHFVQDTRTVLVSSVMKPDTPLLKPACCSMACWGFSCFFSVDCAPKRHDVSQSSFHHLSIPMNNGTSWLKTQSALKPTYLSSTLCSFIPFSITRTPLLNISPSLPPRKRCCKVLWEGQQCQ